MLRVSTCCVGFHHRGAEYSNTVIGVSLFINGVQVVVSVALVVISHADLSTRSTHSEGIGPIESKLPDPPLGSSHRTRSTSSPAR
jgi:hypothetical protein